MEGSATLGIILAISVIGGWYISGNLSSYVPARYFGEFRWWVIGALFSIGITIYLLEEFLS